MNTNKCLLFKLFDNVAYPYWCHITKYKEMAAIQSFGNVAYQYWSHLTEYKQMTEV